MTEKDYKTVEGLCIKYELSFIHNPYMTIYEYNVYKAIHYEYNNLIDMIHRFSSGTLNLISYTKHAQEKLSKLIKFNNEIQMLPFMEPFIWEGKKK